MKTKPKIIVILGQTATGKSDLAVDIALKFNGEVISADSRQIYTGLDLGTGKITKKEMRKIPHYLLDVANPKIKFSVSEYQKQTKEKISDILKRGKLPILVGGTGFYIQSIVDDMVLPEVEPNKELRKKLEKFPVDKLSKMLLRLDPERSKNIDNKNPARLIRAIEIAEALGKVPKIKKVESKYEIIQIGLKIPDQELKKRIEKRLINRIKKGMIKEVENLHKKGLSWRRMNELGLEYRYLALYLQNKITKKEMFDQLNTAIWQYAKRQMTWFKRDQNINWLNPLKKTEISKEIKLIKKFLTF